MTALDPVRSASDHPAGAPRVRAGPDGRPPWFLTMATWLCGLRARSALPFGRGPDRDAANLTDRQLADIGLTRSDLPDDRGWRR